MTSNNAAATNLGNNTSPRSADVIDDDDDGDSNRICSNDEAKAVDVYTETDSSNQPPESQPQHRGAVVVRTELQKVGSAGCRLLLPLEHV